MQEVQTTTGTVRVPQKAVEFWGKLGPNAPVQRFEMVKTDRNTGVLTARLKRTFPQLPAPTVDYYIKTIEQIHNGRGKGKNLGKKIYVLFPVPNEKESKPKRTKRAPEQPENS